MCHTHVTLSAFQELHFASELRRNRSPGIRQGMAVHIGNLRAVLRIPSCRRVKGQDTLHGELFPRVTSWLLPLLLLPTRRPVP